MGVRVQACLANLTCAAFQLWRGWSVRLCLAALVAGAMLSADAAAQSPDEPRPTSIFDEVRIGVLKHHIEPAGTEKGTDINFEVLFARPAVPYSHQAADIFLFLRP